jgi:hypothetical protein
MPRPALVFDLDGTLVDSVYQHVLAWHEALHANGIELSVWRIHRRIGMSGGLFTRQLLRESMPLGDRSPVYHSCEPAGNAAVATIIAIKMNNQHIIPISNARDQDRAVAKPAAPLLHNNGDPDALRRVVAPSEWSRTRRSSGEAARAFLPSPPAGVLGASLPPQPDEPLDRRRHRRLRKHQLQAR